MSDKKVLIIAYYWPPSIRSGVQRWLKFVKYLPSFGWKPYVFTPAIPSFEIKDEAYKEDVPAEAEVIHFIPDPRVFWIRPSVKFLAGYVKKNQINTIITTGPPHSVHLIGLKLKTKNPELRWLADSRDIWSEWGLLDSLHAGTSIKTLNRRLKKNVLQTADEVITIAPYYVSEFERLSERKVNLLTNGFDDDDFVNFKLKKPDRFLVRHIGIVNEKCDPRPFMKVIAELCNGNEGIRKSVTVDFVGKVPASFKKFVRQNQPLESITTFTDPVPHDQLIDIYASSAVVVLILTGHEDAEGYLPGKLFEYIATGLPVLGIGPASGNAASILDKGCFGKMFDHTDNEGVKRFLEKCFLDWKTSNLTSQKTNISYSRKELTRNLVALLE